MSTGEPAATTQRPRAAVAVGPVAQKAPPGAAVAESAEELTEMLSDPQGPSEVWLRARSYEGTFTVGRKLALRGETGAVLDGGHRGTVLRIEADGASVDNIVIRNSGSRQTTEDAGIKAKGTEIAIRHVRVESSLFGITIGPCPRCRIEYSAVQGPSDDVQFKGDGIKVWESHDAVVRGCSLDHVRDVVVWYSRHALLEHNTIRNSRYGTHFMYASDSVMRDSRVENDVVGVFVMYSSRLRIEHNVLAGARGAAGVGIGFKESDAVHVVGNAIVANTTGSYLDETPRSAGQPALFTGNTFALNDVALRFHGVGEGLAFTDNDFRENTTLADVEGGGDALSIAFRGNHYSDYVGYDLDGDGVGDVAYQAKRLANEIMDEHPSLAFFQGTAAMGLVDAVANAMPIFASRVLLEDRAPRLRERSGP